METSLPTPPVGVTAPTVSSTNVRTWNILCHASALLGVFLHFPGHLLGPLIVWLAKRDDSPEIDAHGKESVNFQISMLIYNGIAVVFGVSQNNVRLTRQIRSMQPISVSELQQGLSNGELRVCIARSDSRHVPTASLHRKFICHVD